MTRLKGKFWSQEEPGKEHATLQIACWNAGNATKTDSCTSNDCNLELERGLGEVSMELGDFYLIGAR